MSQIKLFSSNIIFYQYLILLFLLHLDYGDVPKDEIYVDDFRDLTANQTNASLFTWGLRRYTARTCDGEEFETFREKFVKDGEGNVKFLERMKADDHEVCSLDNGDDNNFFSFSEIWFI